MIRSSDKNANTHLRLTLKPVFLARGDTKFLILHLWLQNVTIKCYSVFSMFGRRWEGLKLGSALGSLRPQTFGSGREATLILSDKAVSCPPPGGCCGQLTSDLCHISQQLSRPAETRVTDWLTSSASVSGSQVEGKFSPLFTVFPAKKIENWSLVICGSTQDRCTAPSVTS